MPGDVIAAAPAYFLFESRCSHYDCLIAAAFADVFAFRQRRCHAAADTELPPLLSFADRLPCDAVADDGYADYQQAEHIR